MEKTWELLKMKCNGSLQSSNQNAVRARMCRFDTRPWSFFDGSALLLHLLMAGWRSGWFQSEEERNEHGGQPGKGKKEKRAFSSNENCLPPPASIAPSLSFFICPSC
jgi:hypothetical protein